jgi:DNA-binding NarL/FixJ family response regulator
LLAELRASKPEIKVLMVTGGMTDEVTLRVMEAVASGVFVKHSNPDQIVAAIHRVADGEIWLDARGVRSLIAARKVQKERMEQARDLTSRQSEVLRCILDGPTNKEIPWNLKASESAFKDDSDKGSTL